MASGSTDARRVAVVVGGNGALGQSMVEAFKTSGWTAISVDITPNPSAHHSVVLDTEDASQQVERMRAAVASASPSGKAGAIVCTAGGWAGGGASSPSLLPSLASMTAACLQPVFTTAALAGTHLLPGGAVVLTGASAALLGPTPGMLAYGAIKAATHHVAAGLAAGAGTEGGLPGGARVMAVCPRTLDTPSNRKWMGGEGVDYGAWTPTDVVAGRMLRFCDHAAGGGGGGGGGGGPQGAAAQGAAAAGGDDTTEPASGALLEPVTTKGETRWVLHTL